MKRIEAEFRRADHLLYVSLKYTKTTDVIRNVLDRWSSTIELCIERLLMRAKRTKKISNIPAAPLAKTEVLLKAYKEKNVKEIVEMYLFFRRIKDLNCTRFQEFRKNVTLIVHDEKKEINVNIPQLYEWNEKIKQFIEYVREKV